MGYIVIERRSVTVNYYAKDILPFRGVHFEQYVDEQNETMPLSMWTLSRQILGVKLNDDHTNRSTYRQMSC